MSTSPFQVTLSSLIDLPELANQWANMVVSGVQSDSRKVRRGDLFLAYPGALVDGREFIDAAIKQGAAVVLAEASGWDDNLQRWDKPVIPVAKLADQAGNIAAAFYQQPSQRLFTLAVTGTNGKTTVSHLVAHAMDALGYSSAVIGTLGNGPVHELSAAANTTPGPIELQALLADFAARDIKVVAMEASSHGLQLGRMNGTALDVAVVTNISRDHLDFHGSLAAYRMAKSRLASWVGLQSLVLNRDDPTVSELRNRAASGVAIIDFSLTDPTAMLYAKHISYTLQGVEIEVCYQGDVVKFESPLLGEFNVYNLLAALAVLIRFPLPLQQAAQALATVQPISGRMEVVSLATTHPAPLVVIDYAHTPDALEQVLLALRAHCKGVLWCVFGCGGDRDAGKRPEMGAIAAKLADKLVLSSDNPRNESPQKIIADIEQGITIGTSYCVQIDRATAISTAIRGAAEHDVVLIAGKGHEDYQEVAGRKISFSDLVVSKQALLSRFA